MGIVLNVALARLRGRDDRFFHDGDVQGEGHGDPFARLHAHGTTRSLESAQFCGDLIVAFRKVWKREVARGAGVRRRGLRHPESSCERLAAGHRSGRDRTGHALPWAARLRKPATHNSTRTAASNRFMLRMRRCISLHRANVVWSHSWHRAQDRRGSQIPTRARWLALLVLGAASSEAAAGGPTGAGAAIVRPRQPDCRLTSPATSASTWTSAPGRPVNVVQVVVGPTGFVGAPEQAVVDYIRSIFADRPKPDLIVTVAGPAAVFARKYRQQLFPDTPLLFAAVDQRYLRRRAAWRERDRRRGRQRLSSAHR